MMTYFVRRRGSIHAQRGLAAVAAAAALCVAGLVCGSAAEAQIADGLQAAGLLNSDYCWKNSYGRGVGVIPSVCGPGETKSGLLCYEDCRPGYTNVAGVCWESCPAGYHDDGALCRKDAHIFGREAEPCPEGYRTEPLTCMRDYSTHGKGGCCTHSAPECGNPFASCFYRWHTVCGGDRCQPGYYDAGCFCARDAHSISRGFKGCPPGYATDPLTCRRDPHIVAKKSYVVPPRSARCRPDQVYDAGLCYTPCGPGFSGVGPVCWAGCPAEFYPDNCGAACAPSGKCAGTVALLVMKPLEMAINIAIDVVGAVFTGGATTAARQAAAAGIRMGVKMGLKAIARGAIKGGIKTIFKTAVKHGVKATLKAAAKQIAKSALKRVLGPAGWARLKAGIAPISKMIARVTAKANAVVGAVKGFVGKKVSPLRKMLVRRFPALAASEVTEDTVKNRLKQLVKEKIEENLKGLAKKLGSAGFEELKKKIRNNDTGFDWTSIDPTGVADLVQSFNKPLCHKVAEEKAQQRELDELLTARDAIDSAQTEEEVAAAAEEALNEELPQTDAEDPEVVVLNGAHLPLRRLGAQGLVEYDLGASEPYWIAAINAAPEALEAADQTPRPSGAGPYKLLVSDRPLTGNVDADRAAGASVYDVAFPLTAETTVPVGRKGRYVRLQGVFADAAARLEILGGPADDGAPAPGSGLSVAGGGAPSPVALPASCRAASEQYGIAAGVTFGSAPAPVQDWWRRSNCNFPESCQVVSDAYGVNHGVTFGAAPPAIQQWWRARGCSTRPAPAIPAGRVRIARTLGGKVLTAIWSGDLGNANARAHIWGDKGFAHQRFTMDPSGTGRLLKVAESGLCVEPAPSDNNQNGARIRQAHCNGSDWQRWDVVPLAAGGVALRSRIAGKCIDVGGGRNDDGSPVQLWDCIEHDNQRWTIEAR